MKPFKAQAWSSTYHSDQSLVVCAFFCRLCLTPNMNLVMLILIKITDKETENSRAVLLAASNFQILSSVETVEDKPAGS